MVAGHMLSFMLLGLSVVMVRYIASNRILRY